MKKTNNKSISNSNSSQNVKWIHPINVCIEGNRIMKPGNDTNWNAAAFSKQYLNFESKGSIEFEVPGLNDIEQETIDWVQMFFVGFSDGALNPDFTENIVGIRLQHLKVKDKRDKEKPYVMAFSVFINEIATDPRGTKVKPGEKIILSITKSEFNIKWDGGERSIGRNYHTSPMVAKIALYNGPKVVRNITLNGDWKTDSECNEAPFHF